MTATIQGSYRGRFDDGNETTATWQADENSTWTQPTNTIFRVRFSIYNSSVTPVNFQPQLECNLNGSGWEGVNDGSNICIGYDSTRVTDGQSTTQQLTPTASLFNSGFILTPASNHPVSLLFTHYTEVEYVLQLVTGDLIDGDSVAFRPIDNATDLDGYSPDNCTITVSIGSSSSSSSMMMSKRLDSINICRGVRIGL